MYFHNAARRASQIPAIAGTYISLWASARRRPAGGPLARAMFAGVLAALMLQACAREIPPPSRTFNAELEYLEAVVDSAEALDPQMIFVLMGQYLNGNQQERGMAFYAGVLQARESLLSRPHKALYLSALALLRASHAQRIPHVQPRRLGAGDHRHAGRGQAALGQ